MALEDLQHNKGVGYRCGNSSVSSGNIHIDTKPRKWYGDEHYSMSASIQNLKAPSDNKKGHTTYLTYIYKPTTMTVTASYLYVRNGKGTNFDNISNEYINYIQEWINNYPRMIFGYKTARMMSEKNFC